jgi:predicted enzyme related to lactoylglutathione lyase
MADPFEQMALPATSVEPDPIFAARLRARVARALEHTRGAAMTQTVSTPAAAGSRAELAPYIIVAGAERAIEWYAEVFGARTVGDPIRMPNGSLGHAELDLSGARLMLSEGSAGAGVEPPDPDRGAAVSLHLTVPDVDAVVERAVASGARLERATATSEYGRMGVLRDPFGHRWMVMSEPEHRGRGRHGNIGYVSLWVPDVVLAAEFFSQVLGWRYDPASGPGGRQVQGLSLHHGLWTNETAHTLFCCYEVDSLPDVLARIRAAGGTANDPVMESFGLTAMCTDDAGVRFAVFEPAEGTAAGGPSAPNGTSHGDLAYVTMEVEDSARTRAFYGSVLGWRFSPGRVSDGWGVDDVTPMTGISGGHERATTVPMYRVDDIAEAVRLVRDLGGSATDPEVQPYGISSSCADNQGTRFYLGQLQGP